MIQQTSLLSYYEIWEKSAENCEKIPKNPQKMAKIYEKILKTIKKSPKITDFEISQALGWADPNRVRPRRHELVRQGLVYQVGKRQDRYTKKTSIIWALTDKKECV